MMRNLVLISAAFASTAAAQWLNYPAPGIPRLPDGKPNLSAPTPRTPDGKPDLYGIWASDNLTPNVFGVSNPTFKIRPEDIILTPEGEALQRRRKENYFPGAQCTAQPCGLRRAVAIQNLRHERNGGASLRVPHDL